MTAQNLPLTAVSQSQNRTLGEDLRAVAVVTIVATVATFQLASSAALDWPPISLKGFILTAYFAMACGGAGCVPVAAIAFSAPSQYRRSAIVISGVLWAIAAGLGLYKFVVGIAAC
jgi:hypothetical protein